MNNVKTYFIRHNTSLCIDDDTLGSLWNNDYIAIHFPWTNSSAKGRREQPDTESIKVADYEKKCGKYAIKIFNDIALYGGYICAKYNNYYKIGKVLPKSRIKICSGKWRKNEEEKLTWTNDREAAKLKCLKLDCPEEISSEYALLCMNNIPSRGTVSPWKSCKDLIEKLVEKKPIEYTTINWINFLSSHQQEAICQEYLRDFDTELPKLQSLLCAVGGNMEDIDIYGLTKSNELIFAQVTTKRKGFIPEKKKALEKFSGKNKIMFCSIRDKKPEKLNDVYYYPIETVMEAFLESEKGRKYLEAIKEIANIPPAPNSSKDFRKLNLPNFICKDAPL